jgi:hypothetical protein
MLYQLYFVDNSNEKIIRWCLLSVPKRNDSSHNRRHTEGYVIRVVLVDLFFFSSVWLCSCLSVCSSMWDFPVKVEISENILYSHLVIGCLL